MRAKGPVERILTRAFENQAAWEHGHELPHRIDVYATGGGACCIRIAADLEAMADAGLTHCFTSFNAISGAGGPVAGYLAGCADTTISAFAHFIKAGVIYDKKILGISIRRLNIELCEKLLAENLSSERRMAIQGHPSEFHVIAARNDGSAVLLDAKRGDTARFVAASSAFPLACDGVDVEGYGILIDGICAGRIIPWHPPCDARHQNILLLQSRVHPKHQRVESRLWPLAVQFYRGNAQVRKNLVGLDEEFQNTHQNLVRKTEVGELSYGRLVPGLDDLDIWPSTTDLKLLLKSADSAKVFMRDFLKRCKPVRQI